MTFLISHIPKTAGTSLRTLVEKFNPDTRWVYGGELALGKPNLDFVTKFSHQPLPSVVMGHFSYGVHRLLGVAPRYITVLRNPEERIVSLFRYQQSLANSPFAEHFKQGITLAEFVNDEITEMTNNHACRMIAGIPPDAGMTINEGWLLELALHNLKRHYELVGTLDNIGTFLSALGALLGWQQVSLPKENVTRGKPVSLDPSVREAISHKNSLDLELYRIVSGMVGKG